MSMHATMNTNFHMQGGWTLLWLACYLGRTDLATLLLENGTNVNLPTNVSEVIDKLASMQWRNSLYSGCSQQAIVMPVIRDSGGLEYIYPQNVQILL